MNRFYITLLGLSALCLTASADPITLTLTPSGTVSGLPGDTVGWGYSIDNTSDDYLFVENSFFCAGAEDPLLTTCSPSLGASTYEDFIADNFTEIAPGQTLAQSFDPAAMTGVGEYSIDPLATAGQTDIGSVVIVYDLFTTDFFSPDYTCCQIGGDMELTAAAEVQVNGPVSAVPEPRSAIFLALGLALVICQAARNKARTA
jgi:hypothetical protein